MTPRVRWEMQDRWPVGKTRRFTSKVAVYREIEALRNDVTLGIMAPRICRVYENGELYEILILALPEDAP